MQLLEAFKSQESIVRKPDLDFKSVRISIRLVVGECQMGEVERSEAGAFLALELVTSGPWARCSLGTPKITSSQSSKMHYLGK